MLHAMRETLMAAARAAKYEIKLRRARRHAQTPSPLDDQPLHPPPAFVLGCGRSGTTLVGRVMASHPQVCYLFEPYHTWSVIEPRTDMINLYVRTDAHCIMDARFATLEVKRRFNRCMRAALAASGRARLIEKTPVNAMRIPLLDALAPGAAYLHMVRDGVDVARSIARIAGKHSYRMLGRPRLNPWWGIDGCKWTFLARDGRNAGHFADEVDRLQTDEQRGAYEWLVSLAEVDRARPALGPRLLDMPYSRLTADPVQNFTKICEHFSLPAPSDWLQSAAQHTDAQRRNPGAPLALPHAMSQAFNEYQARFGFEGRAVPI